MVLKAVNRVSRFMTKVGDVFCGDKLDIEFRFYRSGGPSRSLHGSWEYYFGFCPINGWIMTYQPIITEDNRVSFIVDGSLVSAILFFFANTLSTKQWEEPESNRATNG